MFASCISIPEQKEQDPLIVDLKEIIKERTWKIWFSSLSAFQKRVLKRKNFDIEVPENFFVFEHIEDNVAPTAGASNNNGTSAASDADAGAGDGNDGAVQSSKSSTKRTLSVDETRRQTGLSLPLSQSGFNRSDSESVSLETKFTNSTAQKQFYNFRFNKQRRTELNVSFQKGFTFGAKTDFSLGLGQILGGGNLGVGAEMSYNVTKTEGQTFEDTVQMEATSNIAVGANSCYTADVLLDEVRVHKRFTSVSRMTLPQGHASVYIKRKRNGRCVFIFDLNALWDVFGEGVVPCAKAVPNEKGEPRQDQVDFVVEGVVTGTLACNHQINLRSDETEEQKQQAKLKELAMPGRENDGGDTS